MRVEPGEAAGGRPDAMAVTMPVLRLMPVSVIVLAGGLVSSSSRSCWCARSAPQESPPPRAFLKDGFLVLSAGGKDATPGTG